MELITAVDFAGANPRSVLTTIRNDSKPQLSNVLHHIGEDGLIRFSITAIRSKYVNLRRRPWAALHISSRNFWSYAVIEADVTLSEVAAADAHDEATDELVPLYRAMSGEHPDWDDYRQAMIADQRVVARLTDPRLRPAALSQ